MSGASVIRALDATETFLKKANELIDQNQSANYLFESSFRWFGIRLQLLCNIPYLCEILLCVYLRNSISDGTVGYVLYMGANGVLFLYVACLGFTLLQSSGISLQRINEYLQLESEDSWEKYNVKLSSTWPEHGEIIFNNYSTRYRKGLGLVLKNLTFVIKSQERVGVVGRTGAGKSSLTLALFRNIEAASGKIVIDGIDISSLGLHDLRSRISIIPQEPVLFSGTLRLNLDPFNEYNDFEIWKALENSHLKCFVQKCGNGLKFPIEEGGENLSIGQRQLICLARALLRKCKILILDEATASVDMETDKLIQRTIYTEFRECTIITVAHRLNTIMDYNRVIVLDQGSVAEFDCPSELLKNEFSMFYSLAKSEGVI